MTTIDDTTAYDNPAPAPEPRPWYRRPAAWIAAAVLALAGLAVGLGLASTGGGQSGPDAILARDGYTVTTETSDPGPMIAGASPADAALIKDLVAAGAIGSKGGTDEAVLTLTASGKALFGAVISSPALTAQLGLPAGVHARMENGYLVLWGPSSAFGG
jgi:hypothetical protein